jgi:hypothetical protein
VFLSRRSDRLRTGPRTGPRLSRSDDWPAAPPVAHYRPQQQTGRVHAPSGKPPHRRSRTPRPRHVHGPEQLASQRALDRSGSPGETERPWLHVAMAPRPARHAGAAGSGCPSLVAQGTLDRREGPSVVDG